MAMTPICKQTRGYDTDGDRSRAIKLLARRGFNWFTLYRDVRAKYALMYCKVTTLPAGQIYCA